MSRIPYLLSPEMEFITFITLLLLLYYVMLLLLPEGFLFTAARLVGDCLTR